MSRQNFIRATGLVVLLALLLQVGLFAGGLYRLTSDESARILTAWHMTWANALEPFLWPPFYKLFVGGAMKLFPSIFFTPRVLVCLAGLLALLAIGRLAYALFQDRLVSLVAMVLGLLAPQRLLFSVVPLSDIYYFLFITAAAAFVVEWLRSGRTGRLYLGCLCVLLAETVRFESGLFAAFIELLLLHRLAIRRTLPIGAFLVASVILFIFPPLWALDSLVWYGSLKNLNVAAQQFIGEFGHNLAYAIKWSPLRFFIQDMIWNPLTIAGIGALLLLSRRDTVVRDWGLVFAVPLIVFSVYTTATFSIPTAATWRTSGVWSLMILPFDAYVAVRIGHWLAGRAHLPRAALAGLLLLAILPMGVRSLWYMDDGLHNNETGRLHQERALDVMLNSRLAALPGARALIDSSTNLDYMDVLAFSRFPDRLILTGDADPVLIGFYEPMQQAYADKPGISGMLRDHFGLAHGGDARALAARDVRFIVVRNPAFVSALQANPRMVTLGHVNDWTLFSVGRVGNMTGAAARPLVTAAHAG